MKFFYAVFFFLFTVVSILAQAPEQISYQAVVRDATNTIVANQVVGMRISVLQTTADGTAVYVETQTPITNANGLLSIYIGAGSAVTATFSVIDWSTGPYFIKIEIDPAGGAAYTTTGTSQLMSVPYALYAKTAGMPTMTNAKRLAIANPATALMVHVTDLNGGTVVLYDGSTWKELSLIQLRSLPDAPTSVTATAAYAEATVSFTAPSSDGNTAITSYTATSSPGDITETISQAGSGAITVTGLSNSVEYNFTVTATNAIGTSAASDASNLVTPDIKVGDFREGGVVFWLDPADKSHGLVCALSDYASEEIWGCEDKDLSNVPNVPYNRGTPSGAGAEIGDGVTNTNGILNDCPNAPAALAARSLGADWFLPSINELKEMYNNKATLEGVEGFVAFEWFYWSSTEIDKDIAWGQSLNSGIQHNEGKKYQNFVRAVRAF
jgi:hypothetical protein